MAERFLEKYITPIPEQNIKAMLWRTPKRETDGPSDIKGPETTKLIVEKGEGVSKNLYAGSDFFMKKLSLGRSQIEVPFNYYSLSNLSRTNKIQVLMRGDRELRNVALPMKMLENIARFLREDSRPREEKFDCTSFAHFVNDVPFEFGNFQADKWDTYIFEREDSLMPGSTIFIAESDDINEIHTDKIKHFAIYLGDGLYLSKFGESGKLIANTLDELKKGFGGNQAYLIIPRRSNETPSRYSTTP